MFVFSVLAMCGLVVVFFRGLALHAGKWVGMSLLFLPIFICGGLLLSGGIALIRLYHDEVKGKPINLKQTLLNSLEVMVSAAYVTVPLILAYLLLWILLGLFLLLQEIPMVGPSLGVLLSFGPFLLNLCALLLCVIMLTLLFFATPAMALLKKQGRGISGVIRQRLISDPFSNLVALLVGVVPVVAIGGILSLAAYLSGGELGQSPYVVIEWFIIMIPFTALLTPTVVFFFNFAAEAHVSMRSQLKQQSASYGD